VTPHQGATQRPKYTCPCCGCIDFAAPPGSYDVCPICAWEDDALQLEFATTLPGGANGETLYAAQKRYLESAYAADHFRAHIRPPGARRDVGWRPIDPALDSFEDWHAKDHRRAPDAPERLYYWRPTFWHRDRVT
jgi:hypothetical protein